MKRTSPLTTRDRVGQLEKIIARSSVAPHIRRAATLRLATLKRQTTAGDVQNLLAGKQVALDTFLVLAAQRSALLRRFTKLNFNERATLNALLEHMPDRAPDLSRHHNQSERDHNQAWITFVQGVITCLQVAKALPNPTTNKRK